MVEILTKQGVGWDEVRRSISHCGITHRETGRLYSSLPSYSNFLGASGEGGDQPKVQQQEEHNEGSGAAQVTATPSRATVTQARAGESK